MYWLSGQTAIAGEPGFGFIALLAFASGMSMIILPCTLPLVFVILPLAAGKGYKKGFLMALLFGLGMIITVTIYGVVLAQLGGFFGLQRGSPIIFLLIGGLAYLFGLQEVKLARFPIPHLRMPQVFQKRGDYLKSFGTGLILGNIGIACPNPLFYVLLVYIAALPDPLTGGFVAALHGLGRAVPLIFLAVLAILGVQASRVLVEKRVSMEKLLSWALVIFGAFVLTAWFYKAPGFWIFETPPRISLWAVFIGLSLLPFVVKKLITNDQ